MARPLYDSFLVGRSRRCDLRIDDRAVSAEHARIVWDGRGWAVQDLGSRNGTYVDGRKIAPGMRELLGPSSVLRFGAPDHAWVLADGSAPVAVAVGSDGALQREQGGFIELSEEPPVSVQWSDTGGWVVEHGPSSTVVDHLEEVVVEGTVWRLHLPQAGDGTLQRSTMVAIGPTLDDVTLHFGVSLDEETVRAWVDHGGRVYDLGALAHHYVLLTLARLRQADAEEGTVPPEEHGWVSVEDLLKMLRVSENKLNVDIHRCRKRMANTPVEGASRLVQRRRTSRQIRLGTGRFEIRTGNVDAE